MIEAHKIMSGREGVKREDFFQAAEERGDPNLVRGKKNLRQMVTKVDQSQYWYVLLSPPRFSLSFIIV